MVVLIVFNCLCAEEFIAYVYVICNKDNEFSEMHWVAHSFWSFLSIIVVACIFTL